MYSFDCPRSHPLPLLPLHRTLSLFDSSLASPLSFPHDLILLMIMMLIMMRIRSDHASYTDTVGRRRQKRREKRNIIPQLLLLLLSLLHISLHISPVAADDTLTVHIIPHSHCDPGWLNTFEGYYTSEVNTILDAVLRELVNHENRKFVWSEVSFFNRWYEHLGSASKSDFKRLVQRGQIEFVNGGWVQNDEANPDPVAMINQMATGHEYILKNFGVSPRIAWQIDPFGHSSVTPSLWSLMGFESLVINRIHHSLKDAFKQRKQMEFLWRGVDVGQKADMFTHVLHTHYSAPLGFDWEEGSQPFDVNTASYRGNDFVNMMKSRANAYRTNHLLVPFGDDFKFKQAERQFSNMDRLIEYINGRHEQFHVKVQYSTLSDYFEAVAATQTKFPVFQGDFFPYADNEDSYWTGYYTTRPLLKQKSRKLNHLLRASEILHVLVRSSPNSNDDSERHRLPIHFWENKFRDIERARQETALFLHHDAITGTSRNNVVADYQSRMDSATDQLMDIMARMMEHLMTKEPNPSPTFTHEQLTFEPPPAESNQKVLYHPVVFFNSLAWPRREVVSIRVTSRNTRILSDVDGVSREIPAQIDVVFNNLNNDDLMPTANLFTISFMIDVPPLGAATYYVMIANGNSVEEPTLVTQSQTTVYVPDHRRSRAATEYKSKYLTYESHDDSKHVIENQFMKVYFDFQTGMMRGVENKKTAAGKTWDFRQKFARYVTSRSGAYIFRPGNRAEHWTPIEPVTLRVTRGPIMSTVASRYRSFDVVTQIYGDASPDLGDHISITSSVSTETNHELVSIFAATEFPSDREFWTHNGVEFMRRGTKDGNYAQNFYPMVLGARQRSKNGRAFTIISSHSMATGSHTDGELELMMHRSLGQDDGRGLSEPVQDGSKLDVTLWLSFEPDMTDLTFKRKSIRLNNPIRTFYKLPARSHPDAFMNSDHVNAPEEWRARQLVTLTSLKAPLPPHVHLLSLLARDSVSDDVVIRFQHLTNSKDTRWIGSFNELFEDVYAVTEVRRATLALNTILPIAGKRKKGMKFAYSDDAPSSPHDVIGSADKNAGPGASQNTNEEGVFLSQAALEKMRQDQLAAAAAAGGSKRMLLEWKFSAWKFSSYEVQNEEADKQELLSTSPASRSLLASASTSAVSPLFVINPLQLHTYVVRISGAAELETDMKQIVARTPPVERDFGKRNEEKPAAASPIPAVPISFTPVSDPITSSPDTSSFDHTALHDHTALPVSRDTWKLIPSRWEYLFVLFASFIGVTFFMQALRVMHYREPTNTSNYCSSRRSTSQQTQQSPSASAVQSNWRTSGSKKIV